MFYSPISTPFPMPILFLSLLLLHNLYDCPFFRHSQTKFYFSLSFTHTHAYCSFISEIFRNICDGISLQFICFVFLVSHFAFKIYAVSLALSPSLSRAVCVSISLLLSLPFSFSSIQCVCVLFIISIMCSQHRLQLVLMLS